MKEGRLCAAALLLLAALLFTGCRPAATASGPLPQRGYLWQRDWTPAVTVAAHEAARRMSGLIILGAELKWEAGAAKTIRPNIDWVSLAREQKPVSLAIRAAPYGGPFAADDARARALIATAQALLAEARARQVEIAELQLDFDCAESKLDGYRLWVQAVRRAVAPVRFVITALPAWLDQRAFSRLVDDADGFVLQVHSLPSLRQGDRAAIFDPDRARVGRAGFADSLGLAAESYGWQGRAEWKLRHLEKAAPLFLTQLALGDDSAIVSLKALIPDREPRAGLLNYGTELEDREKWTPEEKKENDEREKSGLATAAKDPLLRRLVTAHILATAATREIGGEAPAPALTREARWIETLARSGVKEVAEAEYLGWLAYNNGKYQDAARWLGMVRSDSAASEWLRAKLDWRAGRLSSATEHLQKAWDELRKP